MTQRSELVLPCILALSLALSSASAQQSAAAAEKGAADSVSSLVTERRLHGGLSKLRRIEDPHLRANACERAQRDDTRTWEGVSGAKAGYISGVAYSTADPVQSIPELLSFATRKEHWEAHRFAVGVCFVRTSEYPEGRYWIDVASYISAVATFFERPFSY
jgi:hypothetical protein